MKERCAEILAAGSRRFCHFAYVSSFMLLCAFSHADGSAQGSRLILNPRRRTSKRGSSAYATAGDEVELISIPLTPLTLSPLSPLTPRSLTLPSPSSKKSRQSFASGLSGKKERLSEWAVPSPSSPTRDVTIRVHVRCETITRTSLSEYCISRRYGLRYSYPWIGRFGGSDPYDGTVRGRTGGVTSV